MKNKTKIMLGLAALTAGTLAAGATGTFAWFTTNKTATATYSNIVAAGTTGNIYVSIKGVTDAGEIGGGTFAADVSASGKTSATSDVSSKDGITFAQPDWADKAGNTKAYNKIKDVSTEAGYFTQYTVSIKNMNADGSDSSGSVKVSLSAMEISGGSHLAPWTRVAILGADAAANDGFFSGNTNTCVGLYQQTVTTGTNDKYVAPSTSAGTSLTLEDANPKATTDLAANSIVLKDSLAAGESIAIGVSVWLEGTMNGDNTQDDAKGEAVSVKLSFKSEDVA